MQNNQVVTKSSGRKNILIVNNLKCVFNEKEDNEIIAVNNFSYKFEANKIHFIIGNSGSGKSTLVSHFNGLIKSKIGNITVDNFEIKEGKRKIKKPKVLRRIVSMVFQFPEYQLFKSTIEKDVTFGPKALGLPKEKSTKFNLELLKKVLIQDFSFIESRFKEKLGNNELINFDKDNFFNLVVKKYKISNKKKTATVFFKYKNKSFSKKYNLLVKTPNEIAYEDAVYYLNKMGLDESFLERSPFGLSGGQKRRVAIAGILAIEPKILIFDEPTAGLDPQGEQEMMEIILNAKKSGQTVFVITHTMDHVLEIGDNVIVMDQGKILMDGDPYTVFTNKELYQKTKMEKPKIIDIIDSLVEKKKIFNQLYDLKPRNIEELADAISGILKRGN